MTMLPCSIAFAQPSSLADTLTGAAKEDYDAGRILYMDGDYAGAAMRFRKAYDRSGDPRLLWNTAAARKGQRRYAEVERLVQQYLKEFVQINEAQRQRAKELLDTIQAFIADLKIEVAQPGATVAIDGQKVGSSPLDATLRVDMGDRRIRVTKDGYVPFDEVRKITANTLLSVNLQEEIHEGQLRVLSPPDSVVRVDGKRVTSGSWEGRVPSGPHKVDVEAKDKLPFRTETVVTDNETKTLEVQLESTPAAAVARDEGTSGWWWVGAGVVVLAGGAASAYYFMQPNEAKPPPIQPGTLGSVELPRFRF